MINSARYNGAVFRAVKGPKKDQCATFLPFQVYTRVRSTCTIVL